MSSLFRLVDSNGELVIDGDTIEYLKGILKDLSPGRYQVDDISKAARWNNHRGTRSVGMSANHAPR